MKQATTRFTRFAHGAGAFAARLVHGALLSAGMLALAIFAASHLDGDAHNPFDAALAEAHAVPLDDAAYFDDAAPALELSPEMLRVRDYVARRYRVSAVALEPVLAAAEESAREIGVDPLLVVAVIAVESSFNPFAESHMGAQGLMQVIPRFHMDKIGDEAGEDALFDPMLNVRVGTLVIDEGLRRYGSLQEALQYYGGARSDPTAAYYRKVMAMKQRLQTAAGRSATASADA